MNRYKALSYTLKCFNSPLLCQSTNCGFLQHVARVNVASMRFCSKAVLPTKSEKQQILPTEIDDESEYPSEVSSRFNFSMIANESPLVQKFVDLGVNLFEIQKRPDEAQYLLTLSIEKVERYVSFLTENGVPPDKIGKVLTKNPFLLKEDLDDLQVRINYLWSKKFSKEMISTIIVRNPKWLSTPVKVIDARLGFLQQTFKLKGDEVREMITQAPGVALVNKKQISESIFALKEEMGVDERNLKKLVLSQPALLRKSTYDLISTFEYLNKVMKIPLDVILNQPKILSYRKHSIRDRHKFLESLGRAQYCNSLPGYVSLDSLVDTTDIEFCEKIAKTSVDTFYNFLKTL